MSLLLDQRLPWFPPLPSRKRRSPLQLGAGALGLGVYCMLSGSHALSSGCEPFSCQHDWQCSEDEICIANPDDYDGPNVCYDAPVCTSSSQCPGGKGCIVRSTHLINTGARDPFTSDEPGRRTCGGFAGPDPAEPLVASGCGFSTPVSGAGGFGGSSSTFTQSSQSSQASTGAFTSGSSGAATSTASGGVGGSTASGGGATSTATAGGSGGASSSTGGGG
jgi:hypothetical protein